MHYASSYLSSAWKYVANKTELQVSSVYLRGSSKLAARGNKATIVSGAGSVKQFLGVHLCRVNSQKLHTVGYRGMHSTPSEVKLQSMVVKVLPALQDNYMYLIIDPRSGEAGVVDPVDPDLVMKVVEEEKIHLVNILTTHHHWDHAGGNDKLKRLWRGGDKLRVIGGDERISGLNTLVRHNDIHEIGRLKVRCLATPCHTTGHFCYYVTPYDGPKEGCIFTGDTLFSAGCGRFFEGSPAQMYEALYTKLGNLPDDTKVFCGHEYTLQNLNFALHVDPDNQAVKDRIELTKLIRSTKDPTVPTTIGDEKTWNPFMRVHEDVVMRHVGCDYDPILAMGLLRKEKDNFKG